MPLPVREEDLMDDLVRFLRDRNMADNHTYAEVAYRFGGGALLDSRLLMPDLVDMLARQYEAMDPAHRVLVLATDLIKTLQNQDNEWTPSSDQAIHQTVVETQPTAAAIVARPVIDRADHRITQAVATIARRRIHLDDLIPQSRLVMAARVRPSVAAISRRLGR
jgi:hypothetical protein